MLVMLRSAVFQLLFYGLTTATALLLLPVLLAPRRVLMAPLQLYARWSLVLARWCCGIHVRVTGWENLPQSGPALIAAKHQSAFDTLVWLSLLPDCCYVLKRELLRIPVWGLYAKRTRMIAVDRSGAGRTMRQMLKDAKEAAAEGRQIVIFPEGTRVPVGQRVPYQPGIVGLAGSLRLPVIPVATDSGRCWPRRRFSKTPGVITLAVLPALPVDIARQELLPTLEAIIETATEALLAQDNSVDKLVD